MTATDHGLQPTGWAPQRTAAGCFDQPCSPEPVVRLRTHNSRLTTQNSDVDAAGPHRREWTVPVSRAGCGPRTGPRRDGRRDPRRGRSGARNGGRRARRPPSLGVARSARALHLGPQRGWRLRSGHGGAGQARQDFLRLRARPDAPLGHPPLEEPFHRCADCRRRRRAAREGHRSDGLDGLSPAVRGRAWCADAPRTRPARAWRFRIRLSGWPTSSPGSTSGRRSS